MAKSERIMRAFDGGDPYLAEIFPALAEYPLPDGSRAILRSRRIPSLGGDAIQALAHRLRTSPEQLIGAHVGDPVGLGEVDRMVIEVESAIVGELKRKDRAPLRVREVRLEVDGLVFNPRRLLETGHLEVLDVKTYEYNT